MATLKSAELRPKRESLVWATLITRKVVRLSGRVNHLGLALGVGRDRWIPIRRGFEISPEPDLGEGKDRLRSGPAAPDSLLFLRMLWPTTRTRVSAVSTDKGRSP